MNLTLNHKTSRDQPGQFSVRARRAFSLVEVMIAIAIFCMSTFVILALVSSALSNARRLQRPMVDAAMIASELSLTNKLVEEFQSGDFGKAYPGYSWSANITEEL